MGFPLSGSGTPTATTSVTIYLLTMAIQAPNIPVGTLDEALDLQVVVALEDDGAEAFALTGEEEGLEREDYVLDGPLLRMKWRGRSAYSGGVGEHGELGLGLLDALGGESLEISLGLGERGAS